MCYRFKRGENEYDKTGQSIVPGGDGGYWIRVVTVGMEKCERKLQVCEKKISRIEYC